MASFIHPSAVVSTLAEVGSDVYIGPFCVVEEGAIIGDRCSLASRATIKTGCRLGNNNEIGEGAVLGGRAQHARGGAQNGGITAYAGDYGFEPNGVIHDHTEFPEESILYFTNNGPIKFIDDNNNTVFVLDWQVLRGMERDAKAKLKTAA